MICVLQVQKLSQIENFEFHQHKILSIMKIKNLT